MRAQYTFIGPLKQLIPMTGLPEKGPISDSQIEIVENAGILIKDGKILKTGMYDDLLKEAKKLRATIYIFDQKFVCVPGFIDAHTHIAFAGSRARDYSMRNAGKTYLEINAAGGGIWDTVKATRACTIDELVALTSTRANRHLKEGVTTIEVKSGYGLNVEQEIKTLKAINIANEHIKADLIPTCLAAHIVPKDFDGDAKSYLNVLSESLFQTLLNEKLSNRIDAFIEDGAFSPTDIESYFMKAKSMGFDITVHADQFSSGGSAVAVKYGALSADHLEVSTDEDIAILKASNVTAVALPGASLGIGCSFTPARKILDAGISLAVGSDWNPGSAPMGDLICQAAILGTFQKLSNAEILSAVTIRAARALGLSDRGHLGPGMLADFLFYEIDDYNEIFYQQGKLKPSIVYKNGAQVYKSNINPDEF